jgi:hypothetical protein
MHLIGVETSWKLYSLRRYWDNIKMDVREVLYKDSRSMVPAG